MAGKEPVQIETIWLPEKKNRTRSALSSRTADINETLFVPGPEVEVEFY